VDVAAGELRRDGAQPALELSASLVEDESRAEDCGGEDRERDAHVGKIGNRPANA
jgi:hypothetical protein